MGKLPEVNFGGERFAASSASGEMSVMETWGGVFVMGVTMLEECGSSLLS